ncbi:MAG: diacylglycerol kinase family lipid kinase [Dehalococcoidia bacterium]|nr:diacylglycerol kinase family lipid kinase [Dehalococcoidia bacterium]
MVNPTSGATSARRRWPRIKSLLEDAGLAFDSVITEGPMHAMELAGEAADRGYGLVVVVGGDGTINEAVNGLIGPDGKGKADLGVICTGTANDFARNIGLPRSLLKNCRLVASARRSEVDVGAVRYVKDGQSRQRFFVNVSGAGFDADLMEEARNTFLPLGPKGPYVGAFLKMVPTYEPREFHLSFQDKQEARRAYTVLVSNGRYAGSILFDPDADLRDGLFEVITLDPSTLLKGLADTYRALLDGHPKIEYRRTSVLKIDSPEPLAVQADGEVLGSLPAEFRVLPKALRVVA